MAPLGAYATDTYTRKRDVLDFIDWWWFMCEIEAHRMDPRVEWNRDMSFDEIAACAGVRASDWALPSVGQLSGSELGNVQLYWPGEVPEPEGRRT